MKYCIIGSGGREHALCSSLKNSNNISKIYCIPGNAGTSLIAENKSIDLKDFEQIKDFIKKNEIDIVLVGPEQPLVDGIVDYLERYKIKVFGPSKSASQLEGSKIFTKNLCKKYNIPTANFGIFINSEDANKFLEKCNLPIVIKADGLASGKGVYICNSKDEGLTAIREIFEGKFGLAEKILIEEFLDGEEMSFFIISDGKNYKTFSTAQDHKRVLEGDKGKNTGGMGAYSPSRLENNTLNQKILENIIDPTLKGLAELGTNFKGFLYAGLMINNGQARLVEYNVRFGDPECQALMMRLGAQVLDLLIATSSGDLENAQINWANDHALCVVMASNGYPGKIEKGSIITGLQSLTSSSSQMCFHAGTKKEGENIVANSGRVLSLTTRCETLAEAQKLAYEMVKNIDWQDGFCRSDIGWRAL